jgi:CHAT domain-containing protein
LPGTDIAKPAVPLITEHEIVNLPSASVLALLRQQTHDRKAAPKEVAVLADPVFDKDDPRVTQGEKLAAAAPSLGAAPNSALPDRLVRSMGDVRGNRGTGSGMPRLVFTRKEADAVIATTDPGSGMEALDFQANRNLVLSKELGQYRIVHFATHGLLDNEHPDLSGLVFSLVDEQGKPQNGFLDLEDIYNLDLPVDMVVLSACETALGKEIRGEGLVGLTRGFMYAGAPRVVASLWKVDDAATADLMGRFYRAMLHDHLRPAAALRQAQLEMSKEKRWTNPYDWAAFVIQGEWK